MFFLYHPVQLMKTLSKLFTVVLKDIGNQNAEGKILNFGIIVEVVFIQQMEISFLLKEFI